VGPLHHRRSGFTLLELLLVIAIVGMLVALLVAGVMRVREAALRMESTNNLRQIIIAVHHFAGNDNGRLPAVGDAPSVEVMPGVVMVGKSAPSLFVRILPYVEQGTGRKAPFGPIGLFISPADPTAAEAKGGVASYAANAQVFETDARLPVVFSDGTSNTIAFAEHYAYDCQGTDFSYSYHALRGFPGHRRATFADFWDVQPMTKGNPPMTTPTRPYTFQVAPPRNKCLPMIPQTPHPGGMLIALADGSARQISPGISSNTFWGAVTPAGAETLGADW
jgi:prepilin-type N-terminal cleavage/methylation domain-containing protein